MISKQAVLELIKHWQENTVAYEITIDELIEKINAIPSISDGWISVEEKELRNVLVKITRGDTLLSIYQTIQNLLPPSPPTK